jgi:DNA repair protein SbcD/Mre11
MEFAMPFEALRFAHAANVFLDHPLRQVGAISTTARSVVVDASLTAFERLIEGCVDQEVDFLLLTGNTFCEDDRSLRARVALRTGFECLQEVGIQVFVIPGSHDPVAAWQAVPDLPECVTIFDPEKDEPTAIMRDGQVVATIHGGQFDRQIMGQLHAQGSPDAQRSRPFKIGVFPPAQERHTLDADAVECLTESHNADYLALSPPFPRLTKTANETVAHCPGSSVSFSRQDTGLQGATFIDVDEEEQLECRRVTTSPLRREIIRLKVSESTTWDELIRAMRSVVSELDSLQSTKVLLVCWEVHGQGGIFDSLHTDQNARDELFQLFGEDITFGSLIVDHRVETVVVNEDVEDESHDVVADPVASGLLRRIDAARSLVDEVVSHKSQSSDTSFTKTLKTIASRTDDAQVRDHAKRVVTKWFASVDE